MTLLASIFAYVEGAIPEDVYAGVFQILVIVSIIVSPATLEQHARLMCCPDCLRLKPQSVLR
eukprot:2890636-Rhodomonas_salina.10